ncbi:MAG: hypothetical protein CMK07_13675 [Ponticaulis sp.]|nr:hypothetical protein [Ponticaulis sp.]
MKALVLTSMAAAAVACIALTSNAEQAVQAKPLPAMTFEYTPGDFLPVEFGETNWQDTKTYGLAKAETGTEWVRVDDDAILIEQASGEILYVAYDLEARRTVS